MGETKTIIYPDQAGGFGGSGLEGMLLGSAMNGGGFGGNGMNNPFWAIMLLAFLRNGFGWGNDAGQNGNHCGIQNQLSAIQETLSTNQGNQLLMDAIKGNNGAIRELASLIGCNQNALIAAINAVQSAICNVGNQVGMGTAQVINAVNSGNSQVAQAIKDCCCQIQQNIIAQGYENRIANMQQGQAISNGFAQLGYAAAENACAIKQNATDNTSRVLSKLDQMEDSRKDREIASLTAALTAATSRAERQAELAPIYQALNDIKCKQPNTVNVPYQPFTTIPNCVAWQNGLAGLNGQVWL